MFDATRLLVAYTKVSTTCRTPHFASDLLTALRTEKTIPKRISFANGLYIELVVNDSTVFVRDAGGGNVSVRCQKKFVVACCYRVALVPARIGGVSLLDLFTQKYGEGDVVVDLDEELRKHSLDARDVQWENVSSMEAAPVGDAIRLLLRDTSTA